MKRNLTQNKKEATVKLSRGSCVKCKRDESLILSNQNKHTERLDDFSNVWEKPNNCWKKKIFNPGRASVIVAIIGNAAAGRNSKLIAATAFN